MAKSLGAILRSARERAKLSQNELAGKVGLAPSHIVRLESGEKGAPRFDTVARLAIALGLSLDEVARECGYGGPGEVGTGDRSAAIALGSDLRRLLREIDVFSASANGLLEDIEHVAEPPPKKKAPKRPRS